MIFSCPHISVFHYRAENLHDQKYMQGSLRFKEHLYARHFCGLKVPSALSEDAQTLHLPPWAI